MRRLNTFFFYELGDAIGELRRQLTKDTRPLLADLAYSLYNVQQQLQLLSTTDLLDFQVAKAVIGKLKHLVEQQSEPAGLALLSPNPKQGEPAQLEWGVWRELQNTLLEFRTVFAAELDTTDAYVVSKKGIYSTKDLIERADNALPQTLKAFIPAQALVDFRESGRCLGLDSFTAAGFHVLRATDATLRAYYSRFVGKTPKTKVRNWGAYTLMLRKCAEDLNTTTALRPDVKTISLIDQIRELHRNPIVHPEDNLNEDKALVLFDVCKSAIVAMASELKAAGLSAVPVATTGTPKAGT